MAYAKFSRAPLKVYFINNPWKTPTGDIPVLISDNKNIVQPDNILNFLRKQKYNADHELSAKQAADTLAFIALIEEKLRPALLHAFWIDIENYCNLTRPWFASRIPFPLNFYIPGQMSRSAMNQIILSRGEPPFYNIKEVEMQIYRDAKECLNLLSYRLGTSNFFFGITPTSFDAFAFGFLAPLYKADLPNAHLQKHLHQLHNLCHFCDNILTQYFVQSSSALYCGLNIYNWSEVTLTARSKHVTFKAEIVTPEEMVDENLQKLTQLVNKECNLIEKMDDNLRSSPQHKSQGAAPLKLTAMTSEVNSSQH
ncbi:metaxin-3 isoform X2 [Mobula hypostoma]|uniref:metaxin-3 isoform X2 n=1 Tax=Mobula hypostoma TaxID=723540 RepID=UPI002FC2B7B4